MVDRFQRAALTTRLKIPLIYGVDSVHGHGNLLGATVFPHNIGLGATRDPALVRDVEHITAEETRATGPQWSVRAVHLRRARRPLGPHVRELQRGPRAREQYRDRDRRLPGPRGAARDRDRVLATAKHFAGDGDTRVRHRHRRLHDRPGRHGHQPPRLLAHLAAPVRPGRAEAPRRHRDAVLLQRRLDRGRRRQTRSRCTPTGT